MRERAMSDPNKEYLEVKAALCLDQANKDFERKEIALAIENINRANRALARILDIDKKNK
jgi:hypothetical protein